MFGIKSEILILSKKRVMEMISLWNVDIPY